MTPEEYFKKWAENCRVFKNYKPIHSHEDMMQFAKDYHAEQLRIGGVVSSFSIGDDVLYVGTYVGTVVSEDEVILKDGTKISSLKSQPQKFRKLV